MRLREIQQQIGLALGGEPGSRLASRLAMPISGDTLLRLVRASGIVISPPPRILGVDDWAWRRGQRYGTIICDLERRRVIDLLPDRTGETLASGCGSTARALLSSAATVRALTRKASARARRRQSRSPTAGT